MGWLNPSPRLHQARLQMNNGTHPHQSPELLLLIEMNLFNPKKVLANEAFPKGSPSPYFLNTLNRLRHKQAG
jgi:hypothetical protein